MPGPKGQVAKKIVEMSDDAARMIQSSGIKQTPERIKALDLAYQGQKSIPLKRWNPNAALAPMPARPAPAAKRTPTQAINLDEAFSQLNITPQMANTNPRAAIQINKNINKAVPGTSTTLDELSRMSFDKLSHWLGVKQAMARYGITGF